MPYAAASLAFLLFYALPAQAQDPYEALLREGDAHYARFENGPAIEAYEKAHALRPDAFEILSRLARTHNDYGRDLLAEKDKKGAEVHFEKAVAYAARLEEKFPDRAESYFLLAASNGNLALFKGGKGKVKTGRAVEEYAKKAIALDSSFALPYAVLGVFYREVSNLSWIERTLAKALFGGVPDGSKEDAVRMLEHAIALDPDLFFAHYELAVTYDQMEEQEKASAQYERVTRLEPYTSEDVRNRLRAERRLDEWSTN